MNIFSVAGGNWFFEIINSLWLMICQVIYPFINFLYQVFQKVASINLFSEEVFDEITGRLYTIMGIAMLFIFAYNLLLVIINPDDKKSYGSAGKLITNIITSFVLILVLPIIFNWMHTFQNHVLHENLIGRLILGSNGGATGNCNGYDYDCYCDFEDFDLDDYKRDAFWPWNKTTDDDEVEIITEACEKYWSDDITDIQRGAYSIAPTVFSAFYYPGHFTYDDCVDHLVDGDDLEGDDSHQICVNYFFDVNMARYTGNVNSFVRDSYLKDIVSDSEKDGVIEFHWLMAIVAGILAVWMFICYTLEIGVRVAKLGFLQLISPIPVMLRILPDNSNGMGGMFKKWYSQLINTYLDVFIRLLLIFFAIFAITLVPEIIDSLFTSSSGDNWFIKSLSIAIVILGILKFAQDAPGLFKEFFGGNGAGNFSLKSPAKQISENKLARTGLMGAAGMASGGLLGAVGNARKHINSDMLKNENMSTKDKMKAVGRGIASGTRGFVDGAYYGAKSGSKSDLKNFGENMDASASKAYEARGKREDRRQSGSEIYGHKVPGFIQGAVGGAKELGQGIKEGFKNYFDITGTNPTESSYKAIQDVLNNLASSKLSPTKALEQINKLEADYMKNLRDNSKAKLVWGQDEYERVITEDGKVQFRNSRDASDIKSYEEFEKLINQNIADQKSMAITQHFSKNSDSGLLKSVTENMLESISENMNKISDQFKTSFYNTLSEQIGFEKLTEGIRDTLKASLGDGIKVENLSDLTMAAHNIQTQITDLRESGNLEEAAKQEVVLNKLNTTIDIAKDLQDSGVTKIDGISDLSKAMKSLEESASKHKEAGNEKLANAEFEIMYKLDKSIKTQMESLKTTAEAEGVNKPKTDSKTKMDSKSDKK